MKRIPLYKKKIIVDYAVVDDEDYEIVSLMKWRKSPRGYAVAKRSELMHRIIMNPDSGLYIDHINHDKLDNRRANLRVVTQKMNMANRVLNKNNKTGVKGVQFFRNKYRVFIGAKYVGVYRTIEEASQAYEEAFKEHFGVSQYEATNGSSKHKAVIEVEFDADDIATKHELDTLYDGDILKAVSSLYRSGGMGIFDDEGVVVSVR